MEDNKCENIMVYAKISSSSSHYNADSLFKSENRANVPLTFQFDGTFDSKVKNEEMYKSLHTQMDDFLDGYNSTVENNIIDAIITFGEKNSGKTSTLFEENGIFLLFSREIIEKLQKNSCDNLLRLSVSKIDEEEITDLIDINRRDLLILESDVNYCLNDLSFNIISTYEDVTFLLQKSKENNKKVGGNNSHFIYQYLLEVKSTCGFLKSTFIFADLDGMSNSNISLINFYNHVSSIKYTMNQNSSSHFKSVNDSKLTRSLSYCFGGNCITSLLLFLNESNGNKEEISKILTFGETIRRIPNQISKNRITNEKSLLNLYFNEIKYLKGEKKMVIENYIINNKKNVPVQLNRNRDFGVRNSNILELIENIDYNKLEIKELKEIQDRMLTSIGKSTNEIIIKSSISKKMKSKEIKNSNISFPSPLKISSVKNGDSEPSVESPLISLPSKRKKSVEIHNKKSVFEHFKCFKDDSTNNINLGKDDEFLSIPPVKKTTTNKESLSKVFDDLLKGKNYKK